RMTRTVGDDKATLEAAVRGRTEQLERIAYVDSLSGVLNRRGFIEAFDQQDRRLPKEAAVPGLLILDIGNFKTINDQSGHVAGDAVIAEIACRLLDVTREQDLCARWGGDEFVVILKDCDLRALAAIGTKILDAVRARPIELPDGKRLRVTTSIGACLVAAHDTLETATSKADAALYAAKRQGRNRIVIHNPDPKTNAGDVGRVA